MAEQTYIKILDPANYSRLTLMLIALKIVIVVQYPWIL